MKCLRKGLGKRDAAMMLLAACLDKKRRDEGLDRFHLISPAFKPGLLSTLEINEVADVVWDAREDVKSAKHLEIVNTAQQTIQKEVTR